MGKNGAKTTETETNAAQCQLSAFYREQLGWRVEHQNGNLHLLFGDGMVGVTLPAHMGKAVSEIMSRRDCSGPILELRSPRRPYWVFLADTNGVVIAQSDLPTGVWVLNYAQALPLPGSTTETTRWVVAPEKERRWLPTLIAVVSAVRNTHSATRRPATRG